MAASAAAKLWNGKKTKTFLENTKIVWEILLCYAAKLWNGKNIAKVNISVHIFMMSENYKYIS